MDIVDAQVYIWSGGKPANPNHRQVPAFMKDELLEEMAGAGVDAALIHPPTSWDPNANELAVEAATTSGGSRRRGPTRPPGQTCPRCWRLPTIPKWRSRPRGRRATPVNPIRSQRTRPPQGRDGQHSKVPGYTPVHESPDLDCFDSAPASRSRRTTWQDG